MRSLQGWEPRACALWGLTVARRGPCCPPLRLCSGQALSHTSRKDGATTLEMTWANSTAEMAGYPPKNPHVSQKRRDVGHPLLFFSSETRSMTHAASYGAIKAWTWRVAHPFSFSRLCCPPFSHTSRKDGATTLEMTWANRAAEKMDHRPAHAFMHSQNGLPHPSRVLCGRVGLPRGLQTA